jgi:hypothetical protein
MGWREKTAKAMAATALFASLSTPATVFGNTRAPLVSALVPVAFTL